MILMCCCYIVACNINPQHSYQPLKTQSSVYVTYQFTTETVILRGDDYLMGKYAHWTLTKLPLTTHTKISHLYVSAFKTNKTESGVFATRIYLEYISWK